MAADAEEKHSWGILPLKVETNMASSVKRNLKFSVNCSVTMNLDARWHAGSDQVIFGDENQVNGLRYSRDEWIIGLFDCANQIVQVHSLVVLLLKHGRAGRSKMYCNIEW